MTAAPIEPGFIYDMPEADYHRDPAPAPSLSSSIAKILLDQSPRHAWCAHPKLNPDMPAESDPTRAKEVGSVVHKLILGRGADVALIDYDDYRSGEAKAQRARAYAAGRSPILAPDYETASAVCEAVGAQISLVEGCDGFGNIGQAEVVGLWQDETGPWGRLMVDWLEDHGDRAVIWDVKTTGVSAAPHAVGKTISGMGYEVSAAHYERGILALRPELAGRLTFRWLFVETEAPYGVTVAELDNAGLAIGRKKAAAAFKLWARCLRDGIWPGYPNRIVVAEYPVWAENSWLAREEADEQLRGLGLDPFLCRAPWIPPRPEQTIVEPV